MFFVGLRYLKCTKMHLLAGLSLGPSVEITVLLQTSYSSIGKRRRHRTLRRRRCPGTASNVWWGRCHFL